jgi:hypothetical protein
MPKPPQFARAISPTLRARASEADARPSAAQAVRPVAPPRSRSKVSSLQNPPNGVALPIGDRVFHLKFATATLPTWKNKLVIQFDKAGEKRVLDSFVERV